MIYSLAKRQPRRGAEAGGGGINSYGNRIRNDSGTGDALIPVAVTTYRDRASHRSSDFLFLVLVLIRHHALALLFDG